MRLSITRTPREHPRFAIEAAIEITTDRAVVRGRCRDISRGGLCAIVDAHCQGGVRVALEISLVFGNDSFSEPLTLPARVVWCTELDSDRFQIGMAFLHPSTDQLRYLDVFVRYLEDAADARLQPSYQSSTKDPFPP